ncbi:MAG: class GN sortase [Hyphomicrobiales bacterium]|nr:MAG: class GN sortase [Hyphomicrobiales bacterium]
MKQKQETPLTILMGLVVIMMTVLGLSFVVSGVWIKAKAELAQVLLDRSFEQTIAEGKPVKPWSWADMAPLARITAKRLDQSNIVLSSASGQSLAFGPGHMSNTPLPGEQGTAVLAAHRDTHFAWIKHLRPGDNIEITGSTGEIKNFTMRRAWIAPYDQSGINADSNEHLLALTTCYPFDSNEQGEERYIVESVLRE